MEEKSRGKLRTILIFLFLILLFIGMTALSFILLHRYAEYGREASVNTSEQRVRKSDSAGEPDKNGSEPDIFLKKLESDKTIRVQLLGDDYLTEYHETLAVTAKCDLIVSSGKKRQTIPAGEILRIYSTEKSSDGLKASGTEADEKSPKTSEKLETSDSEQEISKNFLSEDDLKQNAEIKLAGDQTITLETSDKTRPLILPELKRGQKNPSYEGKIEVSGTEKGLLAVNEVSLETYLQSVVSSEMPSYYPMQALCAQAICARTYAVNCIAQSEKQKKAADLDDSVSCQVYNNYPGDELSTQAVRMTEGLIMSGSDAYYYSTSCLTEGKTNLNREKNFRKFLDTQPEKDAEYGSPWVRWSVELPKEQVLDKLRELYGCAWKKLQRVEVLERNPEGQVQTLSFSDGSEQLTVNGEYQIRRVLDCSRAEILLTDGSRAENLQLLPSAYFYIQKEKEKSENEAQTEEEVPGGSDVIFIRGGGYGHGLGMSQNGAAAMAQNGAGYEEILRYYYL